VTLDCEAVPNVVAEPVQDDSWNGRMVCFYFNATLPDISSASLRFKVRVFVNTIPAGHVIFKIVVRPGGRDLPLTFVDQKGQSVRDVFLSYASEDRVEVLKVAQTINALKMRYFQDVLSMSPGERWEKKIYLEIDKSDTFLLFWSSHAQHSEWVIREAEYALKRAQAKQLEIVPYLLEGPPPPPPPKSLKELHFNDPTRYAIFAEESIRRSKVSSGVRDSGTSLAPPTLTPPSPQRLTPLSNVSEEVASVKATQTSESAIMLIAGITLIVLAIIFFFDLPREMIFSKPPEHFSPPKSSSESPSAPPKLRPFDDTQSR
jgi:TIR domain